MEIPAFLRFTPVPLKARYDGWSPEMQLRFIASLARAHRPAGLAKRDDDRTPFEAMLDRLYPLKADNPDKADGSRM